MTGQQIAAIRAAYLDGEPAEKIAAAAGVTLEESETYLTAWCSAGCPDGPL